MRHTELMKLNLPEQSDSFNIDHFNENTGKIDARFKTLNGVSSSDKAEMLALLGAQQTRLDVLRRNDYRIFIKKLYQGKNAAPKGFWFELFQNDSNQDKTLTPDGFVTEYNCVKMWYTTEVIQMGRTNNHELAVTASGEEETAGFVLRFPKEKSVPHGSIRLSFFARAGWSRTLTCTFRCETGGPYLIYQHIQIDQGYREIVLSTGAQMPEDSGGIFTASGSEDTFYFQRENSTAPGGIVLGGGGNLVGTLSLQNVARTGDYLYTKEQAMPESFTKITLFTRCKRNPGESITPEVSVNGGGTWRGFSSPVIVPSVNNDNQPCDECKYVLAGLPGGTKFKLRFYFSRADKNKTPELYDYCVLYE